ncbi:MAG: MerR family transcriptional regulator [Candidatus Omnitrophica bacterium]|nr:MerR family transcriptional regulator [Candidatus Omnitrophota bacterium]
MEKKYFMKDVEKMLGVTRLNIFYWEKTGKIPKAKRTPMGNYRYWLKEDVEKIKQLLRD